MPVKYINRKDNAYFLHQGQTKTGKPKYYFSKKSDGVLCNAVPEGFEVYENPHGQVYCRRKQKQQITELEIEAVQAALRACGKENCTLVDVKGKDLIVWESNARELAVGMETIVEKLGFGPFGPKFNLARLARYTEVLKFTLVDEDKRLYAPYRWSWSGSIDDWIGLIELPQPLPDLVHLYAPHIGEESFFELM